MVFTNTTPTPSHSQQQEEQIDDISVFLRQILHHNRSSPSSSSSQPLITASSSVTPMRTHAPNHNFSSSNNNFTPVQLQHHHQQYQLHSGPPAIFSGSDRLVIDRVSHNVVLHPPTGFTPPAGSNLSSESLSGSVQLPSFDHSNNEFPEDNEFDSEEREEVVVEDVEIKQQTSRNQSKRSRAAEVHNLSEKRRRSRINEKMKALQNLIPNSNKTDKASMLDEAIEYLKQLQLQVQMLSLRNGLSLHPMSIRPGLHPSQLSQLGINFDSGGGSGSYDFNLTNPLSNTVPETSNSVLNLRNQCTSSVRPSLPVASTIIDPVSTPFGHESCMPANFGPFQLRNSQAICRERSMPQERSVDNIETRSSVTEFSRPGYNPVERRIQQNLGPQETLLENDSTQNQLISNNFGLLATTSGAQMTG